MGGLFRQAFTNYEGTPMSAFRKSLAAAALGGAIVFALFVSLSGALSAATVYDLKTDWSDVANPNGSWSYREGNNALPHANDWQGLAGDFTGVQPAWARSETGNTNLPAWMKIASPAGIVTGWQLGDIVTHSTDDFNGVGSGPSNVIWTSPINGKIDVSGGVWMGRDIGRGNLWDISKNGISLTGGAIFSGDAYSRSNPFLFSAGSGGPTVLNQISVSVGDVLKLQITRTSAPGDYAVINLTLTATADLPGDFNHDGSVGALDFVVWRKGLGTLYSQGDYDIWRSHFGQVAGSGMETIANAAVPEPSTVFSLLPRSQLC
jgi:hypothetical protein